MVDLLIELVVFVIVAGLIYWVVMRLVGLFGLPAQVVGIVQVILVVVFVLVLLSFLVGGARFPLLHR
jgi:hypothetical protein